MLVLLDNNFVDRPGLATYFEASPANRAAIPHTAFVEWHKGDAEKIVRKVFPQACRHASRIVILKDTQSILRMRGRPKGIMARLIDDAQTRHFPDYCSTFVTSPPSPEISQRFDEHRENARAQAQALNDEAHRMMTLFASWDERLNSAELREMNGLLDRDEKLTDGLQVKTFLLADELGRNLLKAHGLSALARRPEEYVNTLAFRYGVVTVALYIRMRHRPGPYPTNDRQVLAHLMDVKIAAQATYFDDFMTNEPRLRQAYEVAMGMIGALRGYARCGRAAASASGAV